MNHADLARMRHSYHMEQAARTSDAARLANEIQAAFPEVSRTPALLEAERLQGVYGMGLTLGDPVAPSECGRPLVTGRYGTRAELEAAIHTLARRQNVPQVARVAKVSESLVRKILSKGLP